MKKYELIKQESGFFRIKALKDFGNIKKGELGGLIQKESNLSQYDDAWVYDNAKVYGNACVYGNAKVCDDAEVYYNAKIYDDALVCGNAKVYGDAEVYGNANVYGNAKIYGDAEVYGYAEVYGNAKVYDSILIIGTIHEKFIKISFVQCEKRIMTIYKDVNGYLRCNIGCQKGMTLEDLLKRIKQDGGMKPHRQQYVNIMKNAKSILNIE